MLVAATMNVILIVHVVALIAAPINAMLKLLIILVPAFMAAMATKRRTAPSNTSHFSVR